MLRVLLVVKNMRLSNGVTSFAMNYYRQLGGDNIIFDFLVISDVGSPYYGEIERNGGQVFLMPSYKKHPLAVLAYLNRLFKDNCYDILHCNVLNSGALVLFLAEKYGVPVRILHSHATKTGDKKWKEIRNKFFCGIGLRCANYYFSCSRLAGDGLFGRDNYYLIRNAINISKYRFSQLYRKKIREAECCNDKLVVITVGRITKQKNPMFIVDIVEELSKKDGNFAFWWFGNGELEQSVKRCAEEKGIDGYIRFGGASEVVNQYYSAADVFILPSLYEGLPIVGIEAQVSGLPVLFSEHITKETQVSDAAEFLSITNPVEWADAIRKYHDFDRLKNISGLRIGEYSIEEQSVRLKSLYTELSCREQK